MSNNTFDLPTDISPLHCYSSEFGVDLLENILDVVETETLLRCQSLVSTCRKLFNKFRPKIITGVTICLLTGDNARRSAFLLSLQRLQECLRSGPQCHNIMSIDKCLTSLTIDMSDCQVGKGSFDSYRKMLQDRRFADLLHSLHGQTFSIRKIGILFWGADEAKYRCKMTDGLFKALADLVRSKKLQSLTLGNMEGVPRVLLGGLRLESLVFCQRVTLGVKTEDEIWFKSLLNNMESPWTHKSYISMKLVDSLPKLSPEKPVLPEFLPTSIRRLSIDVTNNDTMRRTVALLHRCYHLEDLTLTLTPDYNMGWMSRDWNPPPSWPSHLGLRRFCIRHKASEHNTDYFNAEALSLRAQDSFAQASRNVSFLLERPGLEMAFCKLEKLEVEIDVRHNFEVPESTYWRRLDDALTAECLRSVPKVVVIIECPKAPEDEGQTQYDGNAFWKRVRAKQWATVLDLTNLQSKFPKLLSRSPPLITDIQIV
ncbi:hypothetical protein NLJ89_g452 [Agrocybe chaxingu]|uniref:Uncharacterized protein n=1 Tax=Agrocybe chaxingu TaxID=84603 RepID=A0A9W8TF24_9AGAR|nr:hypothetical protein NLJ89_g452 [Agrocybe chaxingu]